jgi:hypothetical protein
MVVTLKEATESGPLLPASEPKKAKLVALAQALPLGIVEKTPTIQSVSLPGASKNHDSDWPPYDRILSTRRGHDSRRGWAHSGL